jgi:hypothetical protein
MGHAHLDEHALATMNMHPFVCFGCRKSFKRAWPRDISGTRQCPECGGITYGLARKFKPPRKDDLAQWRKVQYLVEQGFRFGTLFDENGNLVRYPRTLKEAIDFVDRHGGRAVARGSGGREEA